MNIQFNTTAESTGSYTLPINPYIWDGAPGKDLTIHKILHGAPAWQEVSWDGRTRTLEWRGIQVGVEPFETQIGEMRDWVGRIRYINFQNVSSVVDNWPVINTWKKCRVIDVICSYKPGGSLKYESVKLLIQPEQ